MLTLSLHIYTHFIACVTSVDPDQPSDQDLDCLPMQ
jgi:hypothetical protein